MIVGLTLICRSSYRGGVEFLRDLLGLSIGVGSVHSHIAEHGRMAWQNASGYNKHARVEAAMNR